MTRNIKSLIIVSGLIIGLIFSASNVKGQYGQEVKGVETEETVIVHKTVDTGIEDHFGLIGFGFISGSFVFYILSKKAKAFN